MSRLIYVDTNIFINLANDEVDNRGHPLAPAAEQLFYRAVQCEFKLLISDWLKTELGGHLKEGKLGMLFKMLESMDKLVFVATGDEEREILQQFKDDGCDNPDDYLHALLARKGGAECLVTRNLQHFKPFEKIIPIRHPSNV